MMKVEQGGIRDCATEEIVKPIEDAATTDREGWLCLAC
jgi:hypothetical protein